MKTTLKEIKAFNAVDVTRYTDAEIRALGHLRNVAYSVGVYGVNGAVAVDDHGRYFKVASRCSNLFCLIG